MISLFTFLLPYIFLLYFLYRSMKEPIFLMGIPFLMFLRTAIFFDEVTIFRILLRSFETIEQSSDLSLLAWLTIGWIVFKIRNNNNSEETFGNKYSGKTINLLDYLIFCLMIITSIGLGIVLKEYYVVEDVYEKFFTLLSLFIGFFIIKDVVRNTEAHVLKDFLFNIVIINSIASGLYFLHQGLHFQIYSGTYGEYQSLVVGGVIITRTFWFMPVLWFFSISYLLVMKNSKSLIYVILLSVNVLGVFISYTRSFMVNAVLLFLLFYLLTGYKNRNFGKTIKGLLIVGVAGLALFLVVSNFLPANTDYFLSRFKELEERPANAQSNNLVFRFYETGGIINSMDKERILLGYGSVTEIQTPFVNLVREVAVDMGWAEVVFRWGYLGLILFFLLYVVAIIKAFYLFMRTEGLVSQLALVLLLTIISQVIESFTSMTIMYPSRFALGLWYLAILSALTIANNSSVISSNSDNEYKNNELL